ncbi:MAG: cytochrome c oxidase accessory protein CcoG [Halarcobacter ebronensis]|uniref:cytochrome c oxidase accessory protein CcoG n=1 Tax=Halarcobacter ebronensis TaxID=1462615 RepID=UPI003C72DE78
MNYSKRRYLTYLIITILVFVIPFIKINGNHILLLSFDKMQFHFLGLVFNMNELYVMPFLLMLLFIGIFAMTAMFGRVWCGWACPQTIFRVIYRDLIESKILGLRRIKNKQKDIDYSKTSTKIKKYISLTIWGILSLVASMNFMWYFVPPEDFFRYVMDPHEHFFMIMFVVSTALFLIYDIVFMKEHFCTYVCPYSRIQSALYDDDTKQVVYNTNRGGDIYENGAKSIFDVKQWAGNQECTTCEACVKVCPTHIDIRKGLQVECINCLECSDACSTVMGKLGKKSLIDWGSTNTVINKKRSPLFAMKNIVYMVSLLACLLLAVFFAGEKEDFLVNVNKTTKLYGIKEGTVTNNYLLTIHNTNKKEYTFAVEVLDPRFEVKRYRALKLEPKQRLKTVLILNTTRKLASTNRKDTPYKAKIRIFAKENKEVSVIREVSFMYPRRDLLK